MVYTNQKSKRNNGSAKKLKGNCYILNIYMNDNSSSWTDDENAEVRSRLDKAIKFIINQSKNYGINLEIIQKDCSTHFQGDIPIDMINYGWTEQVFNPMDFPSGNAFVESIKRHPYYADEVAILFHVKKNGQAYSLVYYNNCNPNYLEAERAIMFFNREAENLGKTRTASYVHEILHLFGAGELYFQDDNNFDNRFCKAKEFFPNEVMGNFFYVCTNDNHLPHEINIEDMVIDKYTAYRIGWLPNLDQRYEIFEDPG